MTLRRRRPPARAADRAASFMRTALLDAAHSAYADWLQESFAVEHLYARWSGARSHERALAFAAYASALEREERAAEVYADVVRTVATQLRAT